MSDQGAPSCGGAVACDSLAASSFFAAELDHPQRFLVRFIDAHKGRFGVAPICRVLCEHGCKIAPSTYYDAKGRPPSKRALRGEEWKLEIARVHAEDYSVYGPRMVWLALNREGIEVARCTVERPADLVQRRFNPTRPNALWVADFTYAPTWVGAVYVAFVIDAYARRIIGWRAASSMRIQLVLDALDLAVWVRRFEGADLAGLVHHTDAGSHVDRVH
jgi:putative transposase